MSPGLEIYFKIHSLWFLDYHKKLIYKERMIFSLDKYVKLILITTYVLSLLHGLTISKAVSQILQEVIDIVILQFSVIIITAHQPLILIIL